VTRKHWIILAVLAAVFAALIVYGARQEDVDFVLKNASNYCFS
jgi:hypothetical protein